MQTNKTSYHKKITLLIRILAICVQAFLFVTISSSYLKTKYSSYKQTLEFQKYHYFSEADALNVKTDNLIELFRSSSAIQFCRNNSVFAPPAESSQQYNRIKKTLENSLLSEMYFDGYYLIGRNPNQFSISYLNKTFSSMGKLELEYLPLIQNYDNNAFAINYQRIFVFDKTDYSNIKVPKSMQSDYAKMLDELDGKIVYYTIKDDVLCIIIYNQAFFDEIFADIKLTDSSVVLLDNSNTAFYAKGKSFNTNSVYDNDAIKNFPSHSTAIFTTVIKSKFHYNFADILFIGIMLLLCFAFVEWSFKISAKYADRIMEPYNILNGFFYLNNKSDEIENFDYLSLPHSAKPRSDISKNIFYAMIFAIILPAIVSSTMYLTAFNLMSNRFIKDKAQVSHRQLSQQIMDNFDFYINAFCLDFETMDDDFLTRIKYKVTLDSKFNLANIPNESQDRIINPKFVSIISEACKNAPSTKALVYIPSDLFGDSSIGLMTQNYTGSYDVIIFKMESPSFSVANSDVGYMLVDSQNNTIFQSVLIGNEQKNKILNKNSSEIVFTSDYKNFGWKLYTFTSVSKLKSSIYTIISLDIFAILLLLVVVLIISWRYSSKFLSPLERVKNAMSAGEASEYPIDKISDESNEIEEMLNVYNKMIRHIKKITEDKLALMREEERANALKIQAQLNALQQQINPHFLYNTLEMINLNLLKYGDFSTSKVIGNLSKIFRYSISRANETVTLSDEIENTKNYLSIWDIRFPGRYKFIWEIDKNLLNHKTLKLILQPIMENCFFHAFDNKSENCIVKINIFADDGFNVIVISDNGCGMAKEELEKLKNKFTDKDLSLTGKGIGICNTYKRLKLFWGDNADLIIESELGKGSSVTIKFTEELK